ncbi:MAG: PAC2 family protein [Dehalococcoidia bacterium]|nr:PAC2 family protein [Dehalococcoidia bacterium]
MQETSGINELVKICARPKLNAPNLLAAWPGISNVAIIIATYLARKLGPKDLAQIRPNYFFDPVGVMVRGNLVEEPQFPQSSFYYHKNPHGEDLVIFLGDAQPNAKSYDLANVVVDVAERFHVRRIYTCAAAITRIHHTEQPRVWGVGTTPAVLEDLAAHGAFLGGNLQIAGLNGLLLGVAKERGVEGACLLGEVPGYAARLHNPMAALAVVRVLESMLGLKINLDELTAVAEEGREHMKQMAAEAMEEYIDYFTEPIWEQEEDEPEDE